MNIHGKLFPLGGEIPATFQGCIGLTITKLNNSEEYYFENWDCDVEPPEDNDRKTARKITDQLARKFKCKVVTYCEVPGWITEIYSAG